MKKIIFYIGILASIWACQQEMKEMPEPTDQIEAEEKTKVSFRIALPEDIALETEISPMTRTEAWTDTIRADLSNNYRAVIIKKIRNEWFIDTVFDGVLIQNKGYNHIPVLNNTQFDEIQTELRPGTYQMGLFLNRWNLAWGANVKKGAFVATDEDLQNGRNILPAGRIWVKGENNTDDQVRDSSLVMGTEIFAGKIAFTVDKNNHTGSTVTNAPLKISLGRKVARFRYLLKDQYPHKNSDFGDTPYWLTVQLFSAPGEYFCEGLDVLGQPYYAKRTKLQIHCSLTSELHHSDHDGFDYHLPVNLPSEFPVQGEHPSGPTIYSPFILVERPMKCTLKLVLLSGQSSGNKYFFEDTEFSYELKPNAVNGLALEPDPDYKPADESSKLYRARVMQKIDVSKSFHPFYELNPVVLNKKEK